MPDIFVPVDTVGITPYYNRSRALGLMYRYAFHFTDLHRSELENFKSADEINDFLEEQNIMSGFIKFASEGGLEPDAAQIKESERLISIQINAYIARNVIDNIGFYSIIKELDRTLEMAIDTMSSI